MALPARSLFVVVATLTASATFAAEFCKFTAERSGGIDLAGIDKVVILAGAGDLNIAGSSTAKRIEARGKACASSQAILDTIAITVRRDGGVVTVQSEMPDLDFGGYALLDLDVALPANLAVEAQDSSGDASARGLKSLSMQDSSGDLNIVSIAELANVRDSSGEILIDEAGDVRLEDSSGDITVREVKNDVTVVSDSSGEIEIRDVGGRVHIVQDSSGDIRVSKVKGDVTVDADSSGGISVADVGGNFTITDDGSGDVKFENVTGKVSVP